MTNIEMLVYLGSQENQRWQKLVSETVKQIPSDIQPNVRRDCIFIGAVPECEGFITDFSGVYEHDVDSHLIILNFSEMKNYSDDEIKKVIAHEIAHYVLGCRGVAREEFEADQLITDWGFKKQVGPRFDASWSVNE